MTKNDLNLEPCNNLLSLSDTGLGIGPGLRYLYIQLTGLYLRTFFMTSLILTFVAFLKLEFYKTLSLRNNNIGGTFFDGARSIVQFHFFQINCCKI